MMGVLDEEGSWRRVSGRFWTLAPGDVLGLGTSWLCMSRAYHRVWVPASS